MLRVFVPTRGRFQHPITVNWLSKAADVTLVVPECEADCWSQTNKLVVPDTFRFSDIRQFILQQPGEFHALFDDDIRLYRRHTPGMTNLRYAEKPDDIRDMLSWMESQLQDGYVHGGISPREGNNRVPESTTSNCRVCRAHFYNADVVRAEQFDFRDVVEKQDFHFSLTMLELGYPSIVSYEFAQGQHASNMAGGCSIYRTPEMLAEGALRLAALHPGFVKVTMPKTKTAWRGGAPDVVCYWKKAFATRAAQAKFGNS